MQKGRKKNEPEKRVNEFEQYIRQEDIVITVSKTKHKSWACAVDINSMVNNADAPTHENESPEHFENQIITIKERDICVSHSMKTRIASNSISIWRMTARKAKTNILKQGEKLRGTDVYVNKHLTRKINELSRIVKLLKR